MKSKWSSNFLKSKFQGGSEKDNLSSMDLGIKRDKTKSVSVFFVLSLIIMFIFIILTVLSIITSTFFDSQIKELTNVLKQKESIFEPQVIRSINSFSKQIEGIKKLQTQQVDILPALNTSLSLATPSTQYTKLSLNRTDIDLYSVTVSAVTSSLPGYLQQLRSFQKTTLLEEQSVSSVRIGENQIVSFLLQGKISPSKLTETNFTPSQKIIDSSIKIQEFQQTRDNVIEGGSINNKLEGN